MSKIGFDFSGTLADDMVPVYAASRIVVEGLGRAMPPFDVWRRAGIANMQEFIDRFQIPAALPEYSQRLHDAWTSNARAGVAPPRPFDGATQLLAGLSAAGHRLFLVSCCWQDILEAEVERLGWGGFFESVTGDLAAKRDVLASLGLDFYVGDTVGDLRACEGQTAFLAVGYGYGTREQFAAAGVKRVLDSPREIWGALGLEPPPK
jgi:phosphoglycolate phosphatase-like HAD superfamily hydrolase